MFRAIHSRYRSLIYGSAGFILVLALLLGWPGIANALLATNGYVPHGFCILWDQQLLWLHVITDFVIGLSYVAIAFTLTYLVYRARRDMPFHWMLLAFGAFIITCGFTHFLSVWTFWRPVYWLSGNVKLMTAIASAATAIAFPPVVPRMLAVVNAAKVSQQRKHQLELANQELETLYTRVKELDDLKTRFFANVSHELRTPLTLILGPTERLLASDTITAEQRHDLEIIDRNARTLLKHVGDLLDITRLEANKMELAYAAVDLAQLVRFTAAHFEMLAQERRITFAVEAPVTLPAQIDAEKIQRVVFNLLSNAFKFTPEGGEVRCIVDTQDERAAISVADSGPGVRPELRTVIFERFHQVDDGTSHPFGGTGLGLSIVKEFVELHGGSVTVDDAPIGGARFCVELPLHAPGGVKVAPLTTEPVTPLPPIAVESERTRPEPEVLDTSPQEAGRALVLVVEDNPDMRHFISGALEETYRVATANDGKAGLARARALRPDVILSDIMMPVMGGDELVQAVRAHPELDGIPIVLLTAKADDDLRVRALQMGAQDYLVKPFSVQELRVRLDNLIALKRTREILQQELASQSQDMAALANEVSFRKRELEIALQRLQERADENMRLYQEVRDALRVREEFLSIASHELKTPLTSLLGHAQLLERRAARAGDWGERNLRAIRVVVEQGARLNRMVETLLDLSRIDRGELTITTASLDLSALVRRVVETARPALEQHTLTLHGDTEQLMIEGDEQHLEQVLHHLIANAIKYSPEGGPVEVHIERQAQIARIAVIDRGMGIPQTALPHLFERFYRAPNVDYRHISGMGIGLYVVQEIIKLHGGRIEVVSTEGVGSTFTIVLPLRNPEVRVSNMQSSSYIL